MKARRLLILFVAGFAVLVGAIAAVSWHWERWERKQPVFQNTPRIIAALQAFSRDQAAQGHQVPAEVSLQDLLAGHYLTTNDVASLGGLDVTFFTQASDTAPQMFLARARTSDGQIIVLLLDGSVQQFSASSYKAALQNSGQPGDTEGPR